MGLVLAEVNVKMKSMGGVTAADLIEPEVLGHCIAGRESCLFGWFMHKGSATEGWHNLCLTVFLARWRKRGKIDADGTQG